WRGPAGAPGPPCRTRCTRSGRSCGHWPAHGGYWPPRARSTSRRCWAWLRAPALALTSAGGVAVAGTAAPPSGGVPAGAAADPARLSLAGVTLGQAIVALLAVLAVGGEYGTGRIRVVPG